MTPFPFPSSQGSATQVNGMPEGAGTPWLFTFDPSVRQSKGIPNKNLSLTILQAAPNPDFNLDMLGMNLNELWGESWDFA